MSFVASAGLYLERMWYYIFVVFKTFWLYHVACRILVLEAGIEPVPPAVVVWSLNSWTAREVPRMWDV